ncbi:MAG: hypothetical protein P4L94_27310 [Telmatospirillum sp.]|nr:hypothetical protein [Telmatospirillum sp.]MDR3440334.1 hypothetical protein [Telmatospirillum sp.]
MAGQFRHANLIPPELAIESVVSGAGTIAVHAKAAVLSRASRRCGAASGRINMWGRPWTSDVSGGALAREPPALPQDVVVVMLAANLALYQFAGQAFDGRGGVVCRDQSGGLAWTVCCPAPPAGTGTSDDRRTQRSPLSRIDAGGSSGWLMRSIIVLSAISAISRHG